MFLMIDRKSLSIIKTRVAAKITACQSIAINQEVTIGKNHLPTHFVSIPIDDHQIVENIDSIQKHVSNLNSLFKNACVDLQKLHLTLLLLNIQECKQNEATSILNTIWSDMSEQCKKPFEISFKGVYDFRKKVLYASLNMDDINNNHLTHLIDNFRQGFLKNGYYEQGEILVGAPSVNVQGLCTDATKKQKTFTPHLTIMKMSRMSRCHIKRLKKPHIDPSLYEEQFGKDFNIGKQVVNSIHLSCMHCRNKTIGDQTSASTTSHYYDNLGIIELTNINV